MQITTNILEQGKSINNGWNRKAINNSNKDAEFDLLVLRSNAIFPTVLHQNWLRELNIELPE